ncbi:MULTISPECIES: LysR substrate-binding domain-containing protein [unclassified Streptomyces]|uniref:LysR substrate-binding domain-containing protein n=1 Tax=unclassified Streptomyces TaxID=2593676 RepID=UPI0035E157E4
MELRQLRYLVAVVEEESFTHAAIRLGVTQPNVSAQIRHLERELGEELLDRQGHMVRTTAAGAALLPHARAALAAVDCARAAVDELAGLVRGQVRVGTVASIAPIDLPAVFADFHHQYPGVTLFLSEGPSGQLAQDLRAGHLDLAIIGEAPLLTGTATQVIAHEALALGIPVSDVLAGPQPVPLELLRERPLVCLPKGTGVRACLEQACQKAGFRPRIAFEAGDPHMVARFAAHGLGIAVLPETTFALRSPRLRVVPLMRAPQVRLTLAWRSQGPISPAARALIGHTRATLPDL